MLLLHCAGGSFVALLTLMVSRSAFSVAWKLKSSQNLLNLVNKFFPQGSDANTRASTLTFKLVPNLTNK